MSSLPDSCLADTLKVFIARFGPLIGSPFHLGLPSHTRHHMVDLRLKQVAITQPFPSFFMLSSSRLCSCREELEYKTLLLSSPPLSPPSSLYPPALPPWHHSTIKFSQNKSKIWWANDAKGGGHGGEERGGEESSCVNSGCHGHERNEYFLPWENDQTINRWANQYLETHSLCAACALYRLSPFPPSPFPPSLSSSSSSESFHSLC